MSDAQRRKIVRACRREDQTPPRDAEWDSLGVRKAKDGRNEEPETKDPEDDADDEKHGPDSISYALCCKIVLGRCRMRRKLHQEVSNEEEAITGLQTRNDLER
jgi:hypothetical protein